MSLIGLRGLRTSIDPDNFAEAEAFALRHAELKAKFRELIELTAPYVATIGGLDREVMKRWHELARYADQL